MKLQCSWSFEAKVWRHDLSTSWLSTLLVADSAYHNAVGGRCIGGGLPRFTELPGGSVFSKIWKVNGYFLFEKKGVGSPGQILKSTLVLFCYFICGVGGRWNRNFRKVSICSIKKVPAPPASFILYFYLLYTHIMIWTSRVSMYTRLCRNA